MEHTVECIEDMQKSAALIATFDAKYPNYCKACDGMGWINDFQSVPYGMGSTNMPVYELCNDCTALGKCPICGEEAVDEECEKCLSCGWDAEKDTESRPPEYECSCIKPNVYDIDFWEFAREWELD